MKEMIISNVDFILDELYNDELNFNNADITSGQRCYNKDELKALIKKTILEW